MTQPLLSIIIPIYNVKKYIQQCVDSVLSQTLKDIEIILVDDGSTDGCAEVVDNYAKMDSRIIAIHQPNSGYGRAVNHGIEVAKGEYIGIVESDDWIKADMFECLYTLATTHHVDVVKSNFYLYWGDKKERIIKKSLFSPALYHKVIEPKNHLSIFSVQPSIWSAIYRRDFLIRNGIKLLETAGASYQDTGFTFKVLSMAERVYLTDEAYLYYRQDNEASSVKNKGKIFCIKDEFDEIEHFLTIKGKCDLLPLMWKIKFNCYRWNLKRLAPEFKEEFFAVFYEEFYNAQQKNLLQKDLFLKSKEELNLLLNHPHKFLSKHTTTVLRVKLFGKLTILKIYQKKNKKIYKFLGIPVFKTYL